MDHGLFALLSLDRSNLAGLDSHAVSRRKIVIGGVQDERLPLATRVEETLHEDRIGVHDPRRTIGGGCPF
jgi:hypothetical protein